ncbi:hypothetical protein REPUB_Repub06bG0011300 [Reevesia pubescens]
MIGDGINRTIIIGNRSVVHGSTTFNSATFVVLQNSNICPRLPLPNQFNTITAQGRLDPNQNTVHNCVIKPADNLASSNGTMTTKTYLGRPWKEYSITVYMQSFMDNLIEPSEYDNKGPGSNTDSRVQWPEV